MTTPQKGNSGASAKGSPAPKSGQAMTKATRTMRVRPTDHAAPNNAIITHRARAAAQRKSQRAMLQDSAKNGGNAAKKLSGTAVQAIKAMGRGVASAVNSLLTAGGGAVVLVLLLTVILVAAIALVISFGTSTAISHQIGSSLLSQVTSETYETVDLTGESDAAEEESTEDLGLAEIEVAVSAEDYALVWAFGMELCVASTALAAYPIMKMKPKSILSQMS